jgi:hypothetical protein
MTTLMMKPALNVACNLLNSSWQAVLLCSALTALLLAPLSTLHAADEAFETSAPLTNPSITTSSPTPSTPLLVKRWHWMLEVESGPQVKVAAGKASAK